MKFWIAVGLALSLVAPAQAQEWEGRLKRIKETRTFVVGYREAAVPFSFLDQYKPVGFGVDLSRRVADELRKRLNEPELAIRWNAITLSTRIPLIVTNTVDMECTTTTNTRSRQNMVGFSNTFFVSDEGIATRRSSGIGNYDDLAGKRVSVAVGTTTERSLNALNAEKGLAMTILPQRTNQRAMQALVNGKADAFVAAKPILGGEIVRNPNGGGLHIVGGGRYLEAFGCMLPKGEAELKRVVDDVIAAMATSGEMDRLYKKWFIDPVPPYQNAIGLPMNEQTRRTYAAPNDTALE